MACTFTGLDDEAPCAGPDSNAFPCKACMYYREISPIQEARMALGILKAAQKEFEDWKKLYTNQSNKK